MNGEPYTHIEQDYSIPKDGDELPTYDDLAEQGGPNSRFGRWRGWIEKRAAERYVDITPNERRRRRERGWGNDEMENSSLQVTDDARAVGIPTIMREPPTPTAMNLHIKTSNLTLVDPPPPEPSPRMESPLPPLPALSMRLEPTHLKVNQFGSRFIPHTTSPIRCLLPILAGKLLLIGHEDGLSVLDMYPQEWSESGGLTLKGPEDAECRCIWKGEGVHQMTVLEIENVGNSTPQGVVLMLVGPELTSPSGKDSESHRTLRMHNLASLVSLAKWTVAQKGQSEPLQIPRTSQSTPHTSPRKHRPQGSLARGLRSLIDHPSPEIPSSSAYHPLLSSSSTLVASSKSRSFTPNRNLSTSSWEIVDDLPLRWATDYTPLATSGSRLLNTPVLSYAIWNKDTGRGGFSWNNDTSHGGRLLAVATKSNIFLYETPRGERAFRFVKEFYTPMQPRSITFFQQIPVEVNRSPSDAGPSRFQHAHIRTTSGSSSRNSPVSVISYGTQLSLFVIFDKKAGWIRITDSAVGEIEFFDDGTSGHGPIRESSTLTTPPRKSRISMDISHHPHTNRWIPMASCELPSLSSPAMSRPVNILTRAKQTHILPSPLPVGTGPCRPLFTVNWKNSPSYVSPRVAYNMDSDTSSYLQLISMGEDGVEVREIPLSFISSRKGKEKGNFEESIRANEDAGGDTGFLCTGGHWDRPEYSLYSQLDRSYSVASTLSSSSYMSTSTEALQTRMTREEGIYGWCRKGLQDWRVLWLGGTFTDEEDL